MDIAGRLERNITRIWKTRIGDDWQNKRLLREHSLQTAFYHHLRNLLTDAWLERQGLRIYAEYHTREHQRIDIAVVHLDPAKADGDYYLHQQVDHLYAAIELKFLGAGSPDRLLLGDVRKTRHLLRLYPDCHCYLGFIREDESDGRDTSWVTERQARTWAKGRVTEMIGVLSRGGRLITSARAF